MKKSYWKIAWRNLTRNRISSLINIVGLATGIGCVILILLYVQDERKFDRFFSNSDHIYQLTLDAKFGGQQLVGNTTPPPLGSALYHAFPEIKTYTRSIPLGKQIVSSVADGKQENHFTERRLFAVDSNYLQVFDYAIQVGDAANCLLQHHSVVLTQKMATKYFGNANAAMGKTLTLDQYMQPFTVTAVLRDIPEQSSFQFDMLIPMADCPPVRHFSWSWVWCQMDTYIVLKDAVPNDAAAIRQLDKKFPAMVRVQAAKAFTRIGQPFDQFIIKGGKWDFHLQPLASIHLYSSAIPSSFTNLGDIKYIYIFAVIAFFIMTLACVNFMNLSTAKAGARAKEVGIRKVLGSMKGQLIRQFLAEAMLFSFISTIIALIAVLLLIPAFNHLAGKALRFTDLLHNDNWAIVVLLALISGMLAGSYPAFYLTNFRPVEVLKGMMLLKKSAGNVFARNGLVVFQFTVSIALIICTLIVFQQLRYAQHMDLGLKKDNVIIIPNGEKMKPIEEESFRQELLKTPGVSQASITSDVPGTHYNGFTDFYVPVTSDVRETLAKDLTLAFIVTDETFIPAFQLRVLKGRNFSKDFDDSASVIVNETTVKQVGWKDPLGKYLVYPGNDDRRFRVIGVVKDFNVQSAHNIVNPMALFHTSSKNYTAGTSYIVATIQGGDIANILRSFKDKWQTFAPATPFESYFLDRDFEALYNADQRMGTVFGIFTLLSILVAGLGLFGLAAYTAERRTKEIGVRKVLGASVKGIVFMLSKEYIRLVIIAAVISFPIAWWSMNKWLENFAYRTTITWWVFAAAALSALIIALATVSFQAINAALANPVRSLRTE
jgi:putative ABC transport system permease protein